MIREPLGLSLLRIGTSVVLFAAVVLLYWSSLSIERELKQVQQTLLQLKSETRRREITPEMMRDMVKTILLELTPQREEQKKADESLYPNLLQEDPFYRTTLPELLGDGFLPSGKFRRATIAKPENLHPFSGWRDVSDWLSLCTGTLAHGQFGKYETMAPGLAVRIEERGIGTADPEFWVYLRNDIFWQPLNAAFFPNSVRLAPWFLERHPVTAHDFKFYIDAVMNPYVQAPGALAIRTYLGSIKEIEVIDDQTFVVRWKTLEIDGVPRLFYRARLWTAALHPLPTWLYRYFPDGSKIVGDDAAEDTYRTHSVWAQNFTNHWAKNIIPSIGPWTFDGMDDFSLILKRNSDYFEPLGALAEGIEVAFKGAPENIWKDFKSNKLDSYTLQPDQLIELDDFLLSPQYAAQVARGLSIERLDYLARLYYYIGWNQARAVFESRGVRQALTMAIDRNRIIEQNLNGMAVPINGTFYRYSPAYDDSLPPWPYDPEKARHLLAKEGWYDSDGDGVLDKEINGRRVPFRFKLTYYVKNATGKSICEYVSTALREIGIDCQLNGVDIADLSASFENRSFDALFLAWSLGTPPEDPKQLWHSSGAHLRGSSNAVGFVNEEADLLIDALQFEDDAEKRVQLYHRFGRILHEEQPYTFLYTPKAILLYRSNLQNVFIPRDRQDLVPGADVTEPDSSIFWLKA